MRRKEKEIHDVEIISEIIKESQVLRLAMARDGMPYIIPLCFGFDGSALYFHCAPEGKKYDYLNANDQVCFEFEGRTELKTSDTGPCAWSMSFRSVIGFGRASELSERVDKVRALEIIMSQYSPRSWDFPDNAVDKVSVWRIAIDSMTGKQG